MDPSLIERIRQNDPSTKGQLEIADEMTKEEAKELGQALSQNTTVTGLEFYNFSDEVTYVKYILKELMYNNTIDTISFTQEDISKYDRVLAELLRKNQHIRELDIRDCVFNTKTAESLTSALIENRSIIKFYFKGYFDDHNERKVILEMFSNLLLKTTTIQDFTIVSHNMSDENFKSFADAIMYNKSVLRLSISGYNLYDKALIPWVNVVKQNTRLIGLQLNTGLAEGSISDTTRQLFANALQKNSMMLEFSTNDWYFEEEEEEDERIALANRVEGYLERNGEAHARAKAAAMQVAVLSLDNFPERGEPEIVNQLNHSNDEYQTTQLFRSLLEKTGRSGFRKSYFRQMAYYLWTSRDDPKWWTPEERREAGLELDGEQEPSTKRRGIESCISCNSSKPKFCEEGAPENRFCGNYCQWIKYNNAPDLRGKSPKDIKKMF